MTVSINQSINLIVWQLESWIAEQCKMSTYTSTHTQQYAVIVAGKKEVLRTVNIIVTFVGLYVKRTLPYYTETSSIITR